MGGMPLIQAASALIISLVTFPSIIYPPSVHPFYAYGTVHVIIVRDDVATVLSGSGTHARDLMVICMKESFLHTQTFVGSVSGLNLVDGVVSALVVSVVVSSASTCLP